MKMLLRFVIVTFVSILGILSVDAQGTYLGLKGGVSFPNLSSGSKNQNPLANGYKSMVGGDFGLVAVFPINDWFSIQPEIDYSQQGGTHKGLQAIPNSYPPPTYLYANFKNVAHLNYLLVPIMARFDFKLGEKFKFFASAGGFAGFLLSAKQVSSGSSPIYYDQGGTTQVAPTQSFDRTTDIKSDEHTFNVGAIAAVGFSHDIPGGKLFIDGGFNYGFIRIQKSSDNGTNYTGAGNMHIGYLYKLK
jgi:hypothetical protein